MIVDVPDELIQQCISWAPDESGYLRIASYVLEEAQKEHPEWFKEENE